MGQDRHYAKSAKAPTDAQREGDLSTSVYGFVSLALLSGVYLAYLVWAYVPDRVLEGWGLTHHPNKYWAIALPAFAVMTTIFYVVTYIGLGLVATAAPGSLSSVTDRYARPIDGAMLLQLGSPEATPAHADMDVSVASRLLYSSGGEGGASGGGGAVCDRRDAAT